MSENAFQKSRFHSAYDVLGYLLRLMSGLWHRQLNVELAKIELTEMQFVLLIGLGWLTETNPSGVNQKDLADACGCSRALASQVIQTLVRKEFVVITKDEKDARARIVRLSPAGEAVLQKAIPVLEKTDQEFWGGENEVTYRLREALRDALAMKLNDPTSAEEGVARMPGFLDRR
jgi:DNA-binding MarR family transcriptional regulator